MDKEERRTPASRLDRNQRRPARLPSTATKDCRQLLDGGRFEERSQRQRGLERHLHASEELQRQDGMPAQREEVVPHADGVHAEHILPNRGELVFERIPRRNESLLAFRARIVWYGQRTPIHLSAGRKR